ncbi:DUF5994 family protein [Amycolatopsis sp. NBC_00345]|uniref:DUF5994 family protein n=1 Tax=Amycolatopsis sp. NBC_00345 TaxID=2975955 RepID=UPI002E25E5E5
MKSDPCTEAPVPEPPRHAVRLRLKPKAPRTGYVDGAWWPRSRDLAAELPSLLTVLAVRLDQVERVTFNLAAWPATPRRLRFEDADVRLEGFRSQPAATVTVVGAWDRHRLTLLVVPPETDPVAAHGILMTAAHRDDTSGPEALLGGHPEPELLTSGEKALQSWEVDGGRIRVLTETIDA